MYDTAVSARFDAIYEATHKAVLVYIGAKCRRVADVGDIFQDTYTELYRVLRKRGADYLVCEKAFVMRLARQKLARYYSLLQRMQMFVSLPAQSNGAAPPHWEADDFNVEEFALNGVMLEEARALLRNKPQDVQKVFFLFYEMEQTIPEVATELGMTESNVKNKLYRTLKEIRRLWA
ncbi:MAG: sigma-70 family RNA polymerase sigma factor [Defluviitaleaceae bacterium]|nr:sigma-70 family RNA polymerase sigma factor [Defluviitaleaceae bacterium]